LSSVYLAGPKPCDSPASAVAGVSKHGSDNEAHQVVYTPADELAAAHSRYLLSQDREDISLPGNANPNISPSTTAARRQTFQHLGESLGCGIHRFRSTGPNAPGEVDVVGCLVLPSMGFYCATKFALEALAEAYK